MKKRKKILYTVLKSLLIIIICAAIALSAYFILRACGFTTQDDFIRLRNQLGNTVWLWLIIGLLQIIQVIFIPISNQIITVPIALVFNDQLLYVWLTSWISIWLATLILYVLGRFGGDKILKWLLNDEEQVKKCTNFLNRGWVFYPLGMLLPIPDDIVSVLAGTGKMKFWFIAVCSFLTRGIDTFCSVYGWGYLTRYWWGWLLLAIGIILLIVGTIIFWKIQRKRDLKNEKN